MSIRSCLIALGAAVSLAGLGGSVMAQSPVHQLELVVGSCAEPGAVVASVEEVATDDALASVPAAMSRVVEAIGGTLAHASVPVALRDLAAQAHAVRVYEPARPPGRLVACGEYAGFDLDETDVQLGLVGSGGRDVQGVVWLHDLGDGTTTADFVIAAPGAPGVAGPTAAGDRVEVAISKSLYLPNPLEIPVGTIVTWVNEDALPHTATATTPQAGFDSGYMALGDSFSHTFDKPGEYPYFCVFHPLMRAVVIVG